MIKITQEELTAILEVAERVARRTGQRVVVRWDRINLDQQNRQEG